MNLYQAIKSEILGIAGQLQEEGLLPGNLSFEGIDVTPPRETGHGDMATNAAMVLAGKTKKNPKELAEILAERIRKLPEIEAAEVAGPGFINLRFPPSFWQRIITVILKEGKGYGNSDIGHGKKINVEYVSANPTGPMHVGHGRGAVVGDALALLLLKAGFNVTKEYYVNDAGGQVDKLAWAVAYRYLQAFGAHVSEDIIAQFYPGDYLVPVGEALKIEYGNKFIQQNQKGEYELKPIEEWLPEVRQFAIDAMMELIKDDLRLLGIHHDVFASERQLAQEGKIEEALRLLESKGLIYTGVLEPPKGKPVPEDWEPRPQTLFKSTQFGDDIDRALKKSDGSWTYFAPDIAYHYDKIKRGHFLMVDILGADHGGYARRIQAAVAALTDGAAELEVKLCQLVKFLRAGEPVKMSKRAGTFMTVREVVEEVGNGVFRFIMLTRKNDAPLDFDFVKVTEQSKDNPVFYVQYAHARAQSVLRIARDEAGLARAFSEEPALDQLGQLNTRAELETIRLLANWPRVVEGAAVACEPHRIAFYLQELAASFHGLWNLGNAEADLRFIQKEDVDLTAARLALVRAVAVVIASGLMVLGVEPLDELR
jgi:arginyl-tRNA synthetase